MVSQKMGSGGNFSSPYGSRDPMERIMRGERGTGEGRSPGVYEALREKAMRQIRAAPGRAPTGLMSSVGWSAAAKLVGADFPWVTVFQALMSLEDWLFLDDWRASWSRQGDDQPAGYRPSELVAAGFSRVCDVDPTSHPLENQFKTGIMPPALSSDGLSVGATCNVSALSRSNAPWGWPVKAGATLFSLVQSGVAYPNRNGRPFQVWTHPSPGSSKQVDYHPLPTFARALPLPLNVPPPSVPEGGSSGGAGASGDFSAVGRPSKPYHLPVHRQIILDRDPGKSSDTRGTGLPLPGGSGVPPHDVLPVRHNEGELKLVFDEGVFGKVFGSLTEFSDFVQAFVDNIRGDDGRKLCGGISTLQGRTACVVKNIGRLDPVGFAKSLVSNEVKDRGFGFLAGGANRAYFASGYAPSTPHGINRGSGNRRTVSQRMR